MNFDKEEAGYPPNNGNGSANSHGTNPYGQPVGGQAPSGSTPPGYYAPPAQPAPNGYNNPTNEYAVHQQASAYPQVNQQYPPTNQQYPPVSQAGKEKANMAMIFGILGLVIQPLIFGILGFMWVKKANDLGDPATAGRVLATINIALTILGVLFFVLIIGLGAMSPSSGY